MRTRSGLFAALLLVAATPGALRADRRPAIDTARDIWGMIQQLRDHDTTQSVRPQAIAAAPAGGPTVELGDLSQPARLEARLAPLARTPAARLRVSVPNGQARLGDYSVGSDQTVRGHLLVLRGDADVYGRVQGNVVTLDGNVIVHSGAVISGDVLAIHGRVREQGGVVDGAIRTLSAGATAVPLSPVELTLRRLAGLAGVIITLGVLGLGLVAFGRHNLEIVSDTVSHSFGRSFVTGLLGQILLLPTFGMLVVGLVLSVAGILLLPFAIIAYVLLAVVGVVGGYLAVAHALGETWTRRRLAQGTVVATASSYRFLAAGLGAMLVLWAAWAALGWVPVAGDLIRGAAILVTWFLGTAGFGAALLSRAGVRENFAGRIIPPEALTDEYLWATPQFGVPAVRRPGATRSPTSGS
ncbi:MAG TPA: polymer-forming cytoskeletal protein [Gemmatimonadales bacterium]|jgi:hypothetical protein|nr:polymer-forming cytoskeletal protein [Gemmatimonadales bacterium]